MTIRLGHNIKFTEPDTIMYNNFWMKMGKALTLFLIALFAYIVFSCLFIQAVGAVSIQEIKDSQNVIQEGKSGGQIITGGTGSTDNLVLNATNNGNGYVLINPDNGNYNINTENGKFGYVGIGTRNPVYQLELKNNNPADNSSSAVRIGNGITTATWFVTGINHTSNIGLFDMDSSFPGSNHSNITSLWSNTPRALYFGTYPSSPVKIGTNNIVRIDINGSGNVGIGTSIPNRLLTVKGIEGWVSNSGTEMAYLYPDNSGIDFLLSSSNLPNRQIRLDSRSGANSYFMGNNIGIGTTSPTAQLDITSSVRFRNCSGTPTFDGGGNLTCASDEKLKKDILPYLSTNVKLPNPIKYKWNGDSGYDTTHENIGFSAQTVEQSYPECIINRKDISYQTVCDNEENCTTNEIFLGTYTKSIDQTCLLAASFNKINSLEDKLNNICNKHTGWC